MPRNGDVFHQIAGRSTRQVLHVFGSAVELLTRPAAQGRFCVMRGVVPPCVTVPLHSHNDPEDVLILAGTPVGADVRRGAWNGPTLTPATTCTYPAARGAPTGTSDTTRAVDLIVTTVRLSQFSGDAGRPVTGTLQPPTPTTSPSSWPWPPGYGYTLGTPENNAAVGIQMPKFAASQ